MRKRHILTAAGIFAAAALTVAGCGGLGGGDAETSSAAENPETTTVEETKTTEAETTTAQTTQTTTAKEEETTEETESVETVTAYSEEDSSDAAPTAYSLEVLKAADGFEKSDDLTYSSDSAEYSYSVLSDATNHEIESKLDGEAASLSDADTGRVGDVLYASGKTDFGYNVTAYRYIGAGNSVSAYVGIQYLSENEISPSDVAALLSDEYISY